MQQQMATETAQGSNGCKEHRRHFESVSLPPRYSVLNSTGSRNEPTRELPTITRPWLNPRASMSIQRTALSCDICCSGTIVSTLPSPALIDGYLAVILQMH